MSSTLEFRYWREIEENSECTVKCCQCHQSMETKGQMDSPKLKRLVSFRYWSAVHVIKVQSQKDTCMGKSPLCPFSWTAREVGSEWTGKFRQSSETKETRPKGVLVI